MMIGMSGISPSAASTSGLTPDGVACPDLPHLSAIAVDESTYTVYAYSSPLENLLYVFNGSTHSLEGFVRTNMSPDAMAVDSATHQVFVGLNPGIGAGGLEVLDESTNAEVAWIPMEFAPDSLVYDSSNGDIYMGASDSPTVTVFNGSSLRVVTNISLPNSFSFPGGLLDMALDPGSGYLYLAGGVTNFNLTVIDTRNNSLAGTTAVPGINSQIESVMLNPNGTLLFVDEPDQGNVSVIDATTNDVVANISLGIPTDAREMAADESSGTLYVAGFGSGYVSVINMTSLKVEASVYLGASPDALAVDEQLAEVFVATEGANAVTVIDARTDLELPWIPPPSTVPVTFTERGLPRGVSWDVSVTSGECPALEQSQASSFTFNLPNGTYYYTSTNLSNYTRSEGAGYIHVQGASLVIAVTYSLPAPPPPMFLGYPALEGYLVLGSIAGVSIVIGIEAAYYLRLTPWRKR